VRWIPTCIALVLESLGRTDSDWHARVAAAEGLLRLGKDMHHAVAAMIPTIMPVLQKARFDKIKQVRDAVIECIHAFQATLTVSNPEEYLYSTNSFQTTPANPFFTPTKTPQSAKKNGKGAWNNTLYLPQPHGAAPLVFSIEENDFSPSHNSQSQPSTRSGPVMGKATTTTTTNGPNVSAKSPRGSMASHQALFDDEENDPVVMGMMASEKTQKSGAPSQSSQVNSSLAVQQQQNRRASLGVSSSQPAPSQASSITATASGMPMQGGVGTSTTTEREVQTLKDQMLVLMQQQAQILSKFEAFSEQTSSKIESLVSRVQTLELKVIHVALPNPNPNPNPQAPSGSHSEIPEIIIEDYDEESELVDRLQQQSMDSPPATRGKAWGTQDDVWEAAVESVTIGHYDGAFNTILDTQDPIKLVRLMDHTGVVLNELSPAISTELFLRFTTFLKSQTFIGKTLFLPLGFLTNVENVFPWVQKALEMSILPLNLQQARGLLKALGDLSAMPNEHGILAAQLYNQLTRLMAKLPS
jgi:hypothetical protein